MAVVREDIDGSGGADTSEQSNKFLRIPLGTSRKFLRNEIPRDALESVIGQYRTVRFHLGMSSPGFISLMIIGENGGLERSSIRFEGPVSIAQRLPDGRTFTVKCTRGVNNFEIWFE